MRGGDSMAARSGVLLGFGLAIALQGAAAAQTLSGRLTSSIYVFDRADSAGSRTSYGRAFQTVQVSHVTRRLGFHAYGQVDGDVAEPLTGDPKPRLYGLYAEWKDSACATSVRLGRQPVFAAAGNGTLDGIRAGMKVTSRLRLVGFAGGLPPRDQAPRLTADPAHEYMAGAQVIVTPVADAHVSLSWYTKHQTRLSYTALRADSAGSLFTRTIRPTDSVENRGALDATWIAFRGTDVHGRADWDFLGTRVVRGELSARARVAPQATVSGMYSYRAPRLAANSIFSVFGGAASHELESRVSYRVHPPLAVGVEVAGIVTAGEVSFRSGLGLEADAGAVRWIHQSGFTGALDGIDASAQFALLGGRLVPALQFSWAAYRSGNTGGGRETALAETTRLTVRAHRDVSCDMEVQVLHNRYYTSDVRFLGRLQYAFFRRWGGG